MVSVSSVRNLTTVKEATLCHFYAYRYKASPISNTIVDVTVFIDKTNI